MIEVGRRAKWLFSRALRLWPRGRSMHHPANREDEMAQAVMTAATMVEIARVVTSDLAYVHPVGRPAAPHFVLRASVVKGVKSLLDLHVGDKLEVEFAPGSDGVIQRALVRTAQPA